MSLFEIHRDLIYVCTEVPTFILLLSNCMLLLSSWFSLAEASLVFPYDIFRICFQSSSSIFFPWIRTGLQNPYGYGNSHIFRKQKVKQTQTKTKSTVITWSSTIFKFSTQYKLFSVIKYNKIIEYVRNHLEVITKQKIIHCIIDNDLSLHLVKYTNRFILQIGK